MTGHPNSAKLTAMKHLLICLSFLVALSSCDVFGRVADPVAQERAIDEAYNSGQLTESERDALLENLRNSRNSDDWINLLLSLGIGLLGGGVVGDQRRKKIENRRSEI